MESDGGGGGRDFLLAHFLFPLRLVCRNIFLACIGILLAFTLLDFFKFISLFFSLQMKNVYKLEFDAADVRLFCSTSS